MCFYCWRWRGMDAPVGTRVPLLARGRIDSLIRPHFTHPAGTAPPGGHRHETVWHFNAKHRLAHWAAFLANVIKVRLGGLQTATGARMSTSSSTTTPAWRWRPSAS